tara:strand:- start:376 stop:2244 length:1869 start_codon:yes stop_codon:yes gene_type:complete
MSSILNFKIFVVILIDLIASFIAINISSYIRIGYANSIHLESLIASIILPVIFFSLQIYKRQWRYFSISDLWYLVRACLIANIAIFILIFIFNRLENIPRLVIIINFFCLTFATGSLRIIYRTIVERFTHSIDKAAKKIPVILIGKADDADLFIRATEKKNSVYKVLGIINEEPDNNKDILIRDIPVLGNLINLEKNFKNIVKKTKLPHRIVILSNNLGAQKVSDIIKLADSNGMKVGRAPAQNEILEDTSSVGLIRDISLEDLLGRRQNRLEIEKIKKLIANKNILITGAGGSIGSELALRVLSFKPKKILLLDISESSIYNLKQRLENKKEDNNKIFFCSDVRNEIELLKIFKSYAPDIVFHAAALKHVSICEENISEAVRTNVIGTYSLANTAVKFKTKCFVLISTDKAVLPSSVMGATKKIAEMITQSFDKYSASNTKFATVRFGNVLGSTGSVVPLFKKQIEAGGPITVTDKNVSRYFMTIREAVDLVLSATSDQVSYGNDKKGNISVLNMGESIKIDTLAKQMIKLAGLDLNKDIKIVYTGLSKGEKLHEELFNKKLESVLEDRKGFFIIKSKILSNKDIKEKLNTLENFCKVEKNKSLLRKDIFNIISESYDKKI